MCAMHGPRPTNEEPVREVGVADAGVVLGAVAPTGLRGGAMKSVSSELCVRRCRELMRSARDASAIEQLRVWLNELEQDAGATKCSTAHPAVAFRATGIRE